MKSNWVTIELGGGLGNQLFTLAAGIAHAIKFDLNYKVYFEEKSTQLHANPLVSNFPEEHIAEKRSLWENLPGRILLRIVSRINREININKPTRFFGVFVSNIVGYEPQLLDSPVKLIKGYFQTWKFLPEALPEIDKLLSGIAGRDNLALIEITRAKIEQPVIIHIRLGDYELEKNSYFGILGQNYYRNSVLTLTEILGERPLWIFSDNLPKAFENYKDCFPTNARWMWETAKMTPLENLLIMREGSAHIIANSSFSWWAASLSPSSKVVVAPYKWFRNKQDPEFLIPDHWIKTSNDWRTN